jgi:adenylate kinase
LISNTSSTGTKYYHLEVETEKFTSKDVFCRPRMALIGKYKSGKSSVALEASQLSGSVLIRIPEIIELFLKNRFSGLGRKLNTILRGGKQVPDDLLAELLALRLKMEDCSQNGWLLDGFPQTQEQAIQMYKKGVYPDLIFSDPIPEIFVR